MIDPSSIDVENYTRIQTALVDSGKWIVIDRSSAFNAIKKEQEMIHREESDRFEDKEKYAMWSKLYSVGAVIVGHVQCREKAKFLHDGMFVYCLQSLNLVDSNTGEVIAVAENENSARYGRTPDWTETVAQLNDHYPEVFEEIKKHEKLIQYEKEAKEAAQRQREQKVQEEKAKSE